MAISPSLLNTILHTVLRNHPIELPPEGLNDSPTELLSRLSDMAGLDSVVPAVLCSSTHPEGEWSVFELGDGGPFKWRYLAWGRWRLQDLIPTTLAGVADHAESVSFDLGGPLVERANGGGPPPAGLGALLAATRGPVAECDLILVDKGLRGIPAGHSGKVTNYVAGLAFDRHASDVLEVLLSKLPGGRLSGVRVATALIQPMVAAIGLTSLQHAWTTELLDALKAIDANVMRPALPIVLNLSVGTQAGSHEAHNPVDMALRRLVNRHSAVPVVPVTAAGNDQQEPVAVREHVKPASASWCVLDLHDATGTEALVEFWFANPPGGVVTFTAHLDGTTGPIVTRAITSRCAPHLHLSRPKGLDVSWALDGARPGGMSCASLMVSSQRPLTGYKLRVLIETSVDELIVNAWLVVGRAHKARLQGSAAGKVSTPGCDTSHVLSVGAVDGAGTSAWYSSRGPASEYLVYPALDRRMVEAPLLVAEGTAPKGANDGTSFAAARVSAAVIDHLVTHGHPGSAPALARALTRSPHSPWDSAIGFGQVR